MPSERYKYHRFPAEIIRPRRLALLPVLPQLSGCRRTALSPRGDGDLRSHSAVVSEVRPTLCQSVTAPPPQAWRYVAPGRGIPHDQWRAALSMAGCRSGWPHTGYSCPNHPASAAGTVEGARKNELTLDTEPRLLQRDLSLAPVAIGWWRSQHRSVLLLLASL
jgi:hypothetical protein